MTTAPQNLRTVRALLLEHLGPHGLASLEVGIVGDTAHTKQGNSYHLGLPEQSKTGYAATESPRDKAGLSEFASALDVGTFSVRSGGSTHNLISFSKWCVAQCAAGMPGTRDIREIIYSPDGRTVKRWDRLGKRTSGDSSHLTHTHFSFFRDATEAGRDQTPLFRRYLTTIGLIKAPITEDTMTPAEFLAILKDPKVSAEMSRLPWAFQPSGFEGRNAHGIVLVDHTNALLTANNLATNADTKTNQILQILGGSPTQVAQALVAAGQDPKALAAELTKLASAPQS